MTLEENRLRIGNPNLKLKTHTHMLIRKFWNIPNCNMEDKKTPLRLELSLRLYLT